MEGLGSDLARSASTQRSGDSSDGNASCSFIAVSYAEAEQQEACKKFEDISALAKTELKDLKKRRVLAFKKNLADLADLEIKHAKAKGKDASGRWHVEERH
ncbi:hypothetical protein COOONC_04261 [Cooperia oncophora]